MGMMLLSLVFANNNTNGQEYIKEITTQLPSKQIIREWGDLRVMSTKRNNINGCTLFHVFNDNITNLQVETIIGVNEVNDFEIVGDYAYFCGNKLIYNSTTTDTMGVFGFFDLNLLPNAPITVLDIPECTTMNKIALSDDGDDFYMTGIDTTGTHRVVEVHYSTLYSGLPTWYMFSSPIFNETNYYYLFDDIALSDGHLVVTARRMRTLTLQDNQSNTDSTRLAGFGRILFFNTSSLSISPSPSSSIPVLSYCNVKYIQGTSITDPLLIEYCGNDWFVVVSKSMRSSIYPPYNIYAFNGLTFARRISYTPASNNLALKDVSLNRNNNILEVLFIDTTRQNSYIYNFDQTMSTTQVTATGHKYSNYIINSLCYLSSKTNYFIAAGMHKTYTAESYVFNYPWNIGNGCFQSVTAATNPESREMEGTDFYTTYNFYYGIDNPVSHEMELKHVITHICGNRLFN